MGGVVFFLLGKPFWLGLERKFEEHPKWPHFPHVGLVSSFTCQGTQVPFLSQSFTPVPELDNPSQDLEFSPWMLGRQR